MLDSGDVLLPGVTGSNSVGKETRFCRGRKAARGAWILAACELVPCTS